MLLLRIVTILQTNSIDLKVGHFNTGEGLEPTNLIRVSFSDHFFDLLVGEPFSEVHHAVLELSLADVAVAVAIEHPANNIALSALVGPSGRVVGSTTCLA